MVAECFAVHRRNDKAIGSEVVLHRIDQRFAGTHNRAHNKIAQAAFAEKNIQFFSFNCVNFGIVNFSHFAAAGDFIKDYPIKTHFNKDRVQFAVIRHFRREKAPRRISVSQEKFVCFVVDPNLAGYFFFVKKRKNRVVF